MAEADLYEPTQRFLRERVQCWESRIKVGVANVGEIDVLGVRYLGGDLSGHSELIAVEVKESLARFAVSVGQAHGYSIVADRCYLAVLCDGFTPVQVMIAGRLGVGLIRTWQTPTGQTRFEEVLTAPSGSPIEELRLQAVEKLGLGECALCRTLFQRSLHDSRDYKNVTSANGPGALARAAEHEQGLMWWLADQAQAVGRARDDGATKVRRYMCPECTWALGSRQPDKST